MERISSRQNAIVKRFRDLARAARPAKADADPSARAGPATDDLLDGEHLDQEARLNDIRIEIAIGSCTTSSRHSRASPRTSSAGAAACWPSAIRCWPR